MRSWSIRLCQQRTRTCCDRDQRSQLSMWSTVKRSPKQPPLVVGLSPSLLLHCFTPEAMSRANLHSSCLPASWLGTPAEGSSICPSSTPSTPPAVDWARRLGNSRENSTAWWAGWITGEPLLPPCRLHEGARTPLPNAHHRGYAALGSSA